MQLSHVTVTFHDDDGNGVGAVGLDRECDTGPFEISRDEAEEWSEACIQLRENEAH